MGVAFHVPVAMVPTEVKEEPVTVLFKVEPVKVPAAAVTVTEPPKLTVKPLMVTELFAK